MSCMYVRMYVCTYVCVHVYICMYGCMCVCMFVCMCVCVYEANLVGWPLTLSSEEFVEVQVAPKPVTGMGLITCKGASKPATHTSCSGAKGGLIMAPVCLLQNSRTCLCLEAMAPKPVTMLPWCSQGSLKPPPSVEQPPAHRQRVIAALPPFHVSFPPPGVVLPVPLADQPVAP